ncbi:MAG: hypothetical protein M3186_01350 [Actinomycetota bacterium]|nr:hypothetical protein [Actinomycetota bacterium]
MTVACLASRGHHAVGVDIDVGKVQTLSESRPSVIKSGRDLLVAAAVASVPYRQPARWGTA